MPTFTRSFSTQLNLALITTLILTTRFERARDANGGDINDYNDHIEFEYDQ